MSYKSHGSMRLGLPLTFPYISNTFHRLDKQIMLILTINNPIRSAQDYLL
ncbi:hypothetical protein [Vibrio gallaecicus]|nr:hypothetical protein [Vibrio gallaecicus]MDN3613247.1 hypothetical protein [Vibrio gallaecicus]